MPPKPSIRIPRAPSQPKFSSATPKIPVQPALRPASKPKTQPKVEPTPAAPGAPPARAPSTFAQLRRYGAIAFFSSCGFLMVRDHIISVDTVKGVSMAPTLSPHAHETGAEDRIIIIHGPRARQIQRGDVVTFWKPHRPLEISIKRVIALEGDTVYPHRGYALDERLVKGSRVEGWDGLGVRDPDAIGGDEVQVGKVVVPRGHVWVEGDNWRKSYDSCDFGPVSLALVDGKALRVWRRWLALDEVGDGRKREKGHWSRVVEGENAVPAFPA